MFALVSSFVDRKTLFCSSQYLTEALKKPTAYCTLTGKNKNENDFKKFGGNTFNLILNTQLYSHWSISFDA